MLRPVLALVGFLWISQSFVPTKARVDALLDMYLSFASARVGTTSTARTTGTIPHQRTTY